MRDDQIELIFRRQPQRDVVLKKTNAIDPTGQLPLEPGSRQTQHPFACVNAINLEVRLRPEEFAQKSSIPLAHDQSTPRRPDFPKAGNAGALQIFTESDRFEGSIPPGTIASKLTTPSR